ncbi:MULTISPECIES: cation:dicarboxylate symporter family transporter [Legionella]|uniref:Amino acid transporter n=1 Tax=Legionella maceachernii TaxID=466 RepID=A0A0W0VW67_9GAMM|nr:cation:dicarboxylase symporter family transporter [Legionella maceachernii]KTD24225.1 amino acid transporter [Legionella maceachernii]SJZ89544.1 Na+/H+-dicarboxylate symporter [Legionella maceachernii]SUO98759.1 Na(+)/serine-threonine symporter [Legionella maceachernii]
MSTESIKKLKLPMLLLAILILPMILGPQIPVAVKSLSYALSLSMKSVLEFLLPFIIFSFVFSCLSNLQKGALFFVLLLIVCVFASNFTALMYGYSSGYVGLNLLHFAASPIAASPQLVPTWQFHLTKLVTNDVALLIGFATGIFFSFWPNATAKAIAMKLNKLANGFLKRVFIPLLPLFILGFIFKLEHEHLLQTSLKLYGPILVLIVLSQWLYITFWYFVAGQFSIKKFAFYLKNVLPASLVGFSTISSAAAMPVLLLSTEKNLDNPEQAKMLVPAIINIHTIGSAIGIPILSLATISTFGLPLPSVSTFAIFALYTALAKYAVAAVPGGVIIVVAPILEAHLGFSSDMVGLITAVYLICDPFGTTANVTGNGVFPIMFTKLHRKLSRLRLPGLLGGRRAEPQLTGMEEAG